MNSDSTVFEDIPKEKFRFIQRDSILSDRKLQSKPVGYFQDAMYRFSRNLGSVVCGVIILILVCYAIFVPFLSRYKVSDKDGYYSFVLPKNMFTARFGFWDGCSRQSVNRQTYDYLENIPGAIKKVYRTETRSIAGRQQKWFVVKIDSYARVGWVKMLLTGQDYMKALDYEKKTGIQLFYPIMDRDLVANRLYLDDQNAWFLSDSRGTAIRDSSGHVRNIFIRDSNNPDGYAYYITRMNGEQYETRVLYSAWYVYKTGHVPHHLFGADSFGYDICVRLAYGARLSLILSVLVAGINLFLGIIIGSLEGYYGGWFDLSSS